MKIPTGKDNEYNDRIERASALDTAAGSQSLWEQRCGHMAEQLLRIMVAHKILRPADISMVELLALATEYADHLENNKSSHADGNSE